MVLVVVTMKVMVRGLVGRDGGVQAGPRVLLCLLVGRCCSSRMMLGAPGEGVGRLVEGEGNMNVQVTVVIMEAAMVVAVWQR